MGNGDDCSCPPEGCTVLQLLSTETRKELEFQAGKLSETIVSARECLAEISTVHTGLKDSIADMNKTVGLQSLRLEHGMEKFSDIDEDIDKLRDSVQEIHDDVLILKDRKQISKTATGSIAALVAAAASGLVEFITK